MPTRSKVFFVRQDRGCSVAFQMVTLCILKIEFNLPAEFEKFDDLRERALTVFVKGACN